MRFVTYDWDGEGWRFGKIVEWKPNRGSLVIKAEGITLRCSDPAKAACVAFYKEESGEDDPLINWALVGKVDSFSYTRGSPQQALNINCVGLSAKRCVLGGSVNVRGTAVFEACTVRDGGYGGMYSSGNLKMKCCVFVNNSGESISGDGEEGVEVSRGGTATFQDTFIMCDSEEDARSMFDES
mmetsp:Transcript_20913/g.49436  ORF Transcript_20913/g.49436 Transcript_20913/m.49436 type:complete len:183 (+) Transcript_20913:328-876(+)